MDCGAGVGRRRVRCHGRTQQSPGGGVHQQPGHQARGVVTQRRPRATAASTSTVRWSSCRCQPKWTWTFFRVRRPELALLEVLAFEASTIDLTRRTWQADRHAGAALLSYVGWCTSAAL